MRRTVADQSADILAAAGVGRVCGIVGDRLNAWDDAIRRPTEIERLRAQHVEIAAFAGGNQGAAFGDLAERKQAETGVVARRFSEVQLELAHANRVATRGMNEGDLVASGLCRGDLVWAEPALPDGAARRLTLTAISYDIAPGSVAAYCPEANGLVPLDYRDPASLTPSYKSVLVRVRRAA